MQREKLAFAAVCDWAGQVRGKGFPLTDLPRRLVAGMGYTHSNIMMSSFGPIYSTPFGTAGDLMVVPDPEAAVEVAFEGEDAERFFLSDLRNLDGTPWECCPRDFLRRALTGLKDEFGLTLLAAFEQEFIYTGVEHRPAATYGLDLFRRQGAFGEIFMGALRACGVTPDSFLPEYAPRQFEVTVAPKPGLRAADEAVMVRELARAVAHRAGHQAIFTPMPRPDGVGSGTHIHFSLRDADNAPVMADPAGSRGLSAIGASFVAGILHHLPAISALTAPSVVSYYRLMPNRWAPTWIVLVERDRGAALRVCPVFAANSPDDAARKFNVEFRVTDATASPYMALGAIAHAGLDGVRKGMTLPPAPPADFWSGSDEQREATGARRLPTSLGEALDLLEASPVAEWLGRGATPAYVELKRAEIDVLKDLDPDAVCARYVEAFS